MNSELRKMVDYLLLKSPFLQDIGLFHGKMGVAVALYAYAYRYHDNLIKEYAWDLFQQVYDGVHVDMPIGLEYGLSGIGYGTTLLFGLGYVECDLNAILCDIDVKIMERDPRRITDFSLRSGAGGIQLYLTLRQKVGGPLLTFDNLYLSELQSAMANKMMPKFDVSIINILSEPLFAECEYIEKPIGIDEGSAYFILKDILT